MEATNVKNTTIKVSFIYNLSKLHAHAGSVLAIVT